MDEGCEQLHVMYEPEVRVRMDNLRLAREFSCLYCKLSWFSGAYNLHVHSRYATKTAGQNSPNIILIMSMLGGERVRLELELREQDARRRPDALTQRLHPIPHALRTGTDSSLDGNLLSFAYTFSNDYFVAM